MTLRLIDLCRSTMAAVVGIGMAAAPSYASSMDDALGRAVAAVLIADACKNVGLIGGADYEKAAADLLATQGFKRGKVLQFLYYGKTDWLHQLADTALMDRGITRDDTGALCAFGKSVAAKDDGIGQFLVKGSD
jgi:hypothetical protein